MSSVSPNIVRQYSAILACWRGLQGEEVGWCSAAPPSSGPNFWAPDLGHQEYRGSGRQGHRQKSLESRDCVEGMGRSRGLLGEGGAGGRWGQGRE